MREQSPSSEPVEYFLVVTGDEVLRGVYADAHTLYIARTLAPLGARCVGVMITPDDIASIHRALDVAARRAALVLVTGGLGPTDDDVTREALSRFTGVALAEQPEALSAVMLRFGVSRPEELRANLRRQTLAPTTGTYFPNPYGTAIGLVFEDGERVFVALPGPPSELQPMVGERLVPFLAGRFGIRTPGATITLRFVGIGESNIDEIMHRHLTMPEDLMVSSLFELDRVDLTLSLPGDTEGDRVRLEELRTELKRHLGEYVYSYDGATLEEAVLRLLEANRLTLITAEMGSGGAIAAGLNQAEGMERVYSGGFVVPNEYELEEMLGRVPEGEPADRPIAGAEELRDFVRAVCEKTRSDWGMVIGRVVAEGDARHVLVAYGSDTDGVEVERVALRGRGRTAQARLLNRCLDLLRRKLEARPRAGDRSE